MIRGHGERAVREPAPRLGRRAVRRRHGATARPVVSVPFPQRAAALAAYAGAPAPSLDAQLAALDAAGRAAVLVWRPSALARTAALAIQREPDLSAEGLASLLDLSPRQAQRILASLKTRAGLVRIGAKKNGEWRFSVPDRWTLTLDAPNLLRVTFGADKCGAVEVREALHGVRIVLRDYAPSFAVTESGRPVDAGEEAGAEEGILRREAEHYEFEMDGIPLFPARPCTALRAGFAPLYRETEPIDLAPGVHRFRIARGAPDDNYFLPALLLAGDFLADGAALRPRTGDPVPFASLESLGLGGFVGTATWTARVRVPGGRAVGASLPEETPRTPRTPRENNAPPATLRVETGGAPAEAFWNGASLGVRLRDPFAWELPASAACAEGELSIAVSTSVAPMFGAPDAHGAAWDQPFWTPPRDPASRPGLLAAAWVPGARE